MNEFGVRNGEFSLLTGEFDFQMGEFGSMANLVRENKLILKPKKIIPKVYLYT